MRSFLPFVFRGVEYRLVPRDEEVHMGFACVGHREAAWLLHDLLPGSVALDPLADGPGALVLLRRAETYGGPGVPVDVSTPLAERAAETPPARPEPEPTPPVETFFEAQLVDGHGTALAGVEVTLMHDGERETLTTDGDGVVRLDGARVRSATLSIPNRDGLRDMLQDAWAKPTEEDLVTAEENRSVVHYRNDLIGPVMLTAEVRHTLSIQPFVMLGRMVGMFFDTNRNFLLPLSRPAIAEMRALYDRCAPCRLLVVGHTDTSGQAAYNEELSRERADSVLAFMTDDVDAWLDRYESSVPSAKRWGGAEDLHMIRAMDDFASRPPGEDPVEWYQRTRGLTLDGDAGPETREALIEEYMGLDGTTLPADVSGDTFGCGEAFPLDATGNALDVAPTDGADDPLDRRVELFFFGDDLEIPEDYLTWRRRARETYEKVLGPRPLEIELRSEDGEPIAGAKFTVTLPVGAVIDGELDGEGFARIERLPEGICRVDFPALDRGFTVGSSAVLE